ncbi:MAG: SRPBCC family protein [Chloroflexota bacterium]
MSPYTAVVDVPAPLERTFAVFTNATRFSQWQALAVWAFEQSGPLDQPGSSVRIDHGPGMKRTMTILDADPPHRLRYRQQGMGFDDINDVRFETNADGTRVTASTELRVAGGPVGRLLERLGRRSSRGEYQAELDRFSSVVARPTILPPADGSLVTLDSGGGIRVGKILGFDPDDEIVHLAILPGTDRRRAVDLDAALDRQTFLRDPLSFRPLDVKMSGLTAKLVPGSPHLRLDGGVGVPHVAMTVDAYSDALPEPTGRSVEVWAEERSELASWKAAEGPVLGRAADVEITPLLTIRADSADQDYAAAKMLRADRSGVHLCIYADRWVVPPDHIDPWALAFGTTETLASGILALGHIPLSHKAYARMQPKFDRLAMLGSRELEGYQEWREAQGGYFA